MTLFWTLAAAMLLIALAIALAPLRRRRRGRRPATVAVDRPLFRQRLAELEQALAEGSVDAAGFAQARDDLERELLHDLEAHGRPAERSDKTAGAGRRGAALLVALSVPIVALGLYLQVGSWRQIDAATTHGASAAAPAAGETPAAGAPAAGAMGGVSMEERVAQLHARLYADSNDPDNPAHLEGWRMLGRSYAFLERHAQAAEAYRRALALEGDDPATLTALAAALMRSREGDLTGEPTELLQRALKIAPAHPEALSLAGLAAFQRGAYDQAATHWQALLKLATAEERPQIEQAIAAARAHMGASSATATP